MKKYKIIIAFTLFMTSSLLAQFGMNRVQYKDFDWFYIQSKHFDIYFSDEGTAAAEFASQVAEESLADLEKRLDYKINNRISLIIYNSHNDFQETNTTDGYLGQGTGGFTEPFKNRVVFPFEGSYEKYRHVISHELVHAVMRDMLYGGTIQNIIAKGITLQLPHWFHEGMAEYLSTGWETNSDQFIRNAIINEFLPDINQLTGYFGYRGGQSVFQYIAEKYGDQKVGELLRKIKNGGSVDEGLKSAVGLTLEELNDRWKKDLKVRYWPEIATRQEPDDFAERITDNKKTVGFYNTSPAISPMGDKVAFISDRDIYLDVYVMDLQDKEKIEKVISSGTENNFEELNVLFPALTWSPDNLHIALSVKSGGFDVISIINTETNESRELPIRLDGIESVAWSPDGNHIAFVGSNAKQSDIYVFDLNSNQIKNLTDDFFSDSDPVWTPDGKSILFSSDRGQFESKSLIPSDFNMFEHNYNQMDLYFISIADTIITRITDWKFSSEKTPVVSPDGKEILFVSDKNGIFNIYKKRIQLLETDTVKAVVDLPALPITNSLNEINQLSLSKDGKKLVFTSLYKMGYNIFMIKNPFILETEFKSLEYTGYMASVIENKPWIKKENINNVVSESDSNLASTDLLNQKEENEITETNSGKFFTGKLVKEAESDTSKKETDYSHYIFGDENFQFDSTNTLADREALFNEKLDENGNFLLNRYKINFSPDLIYANAGWSTLYGLLGTTVLSFSDILGNHRLIGITSLQIDLKNSDYGLAYYYLANRLNIGFEGFHTARFVYLNRGNGSDLFRFRNFGLVLSASYPFNRFYRMDFGMNVMSVSSENLDNFNEPSDQSTYYVPSASFVHDNTMWGYYSPIQGVRYSITTLGDIGIANSNQSFVSLLWDYRKYFRFWYDNSFVFRFSGGYSGGANPQRFFLGGTENWINRSFATGDIPLTKASDFAFLSPALPLRGYDYAEQLGTKYSLLNLELRMPLIRYLLTGPLPLFFQNILGTVFIDAGSAWDSNSQLRLFTKDENNTRITDDLLIGTGFGVRTYFLFALIRFDIAWKYDIDNFSKPRYYLSIGTDF
ncbi:MAG: biopolymer transporter Tol [Bacteroidetes bacterium]|nr:biopolymer transporter Tol [Bacteroidota bacterium]